MATVERISDPTEWRWSQPEPDAIRVDFLTGPLMERAGIPMDMTAEADARYFAVLDEFLATVQDRVTVRTTGYRWGPAAGGDDFAFVHLLAEALDLAAKVGLITSFVAWLKSKGALEIRIDESGVESLGKWELVRNGYGDDPQTVSIGRMPGSGETPWGTPRQLGGYAAVFRLGDGRLAVLIFGLDGTLKELAVPPAGG